jgi:hypothetical protein
VFQPYVFRKPFDYYILRQTVASFAAGEPHFVGFDGSEFDYHGMANAWFRLWQSDGLTLDTLFQLEEAAAKYPTFEHTTFITKIRYNRPEQDFPYFIDLNAPWCDLPDGDPQGSLARGLPPELQKVEGRVIGHQQVKFDIGVFNVTCMSFRDEFRFLNVGMRLTGPGTCYSGILGQTLFPPEDRVDNLKFLVSLDPRGAADGDACKGTRH